MPEHCAAYSCTTRRTVESRVRGITFHRFPKGKDSRKKWEVALRRKRFTASDSSVICSEHFKQEDFDRTGQVVRLREGVIPSIFNFPVRQKKLEKGRTRSTSRKAEESQSLAPQDEPEASTSHSQTQVHLERGRTRSASRKAEESRSLAPQDEPEASTSHSQPQLEEADEGLCCASEDEPEASPPHSQPHDLEKGGTTSASGTAEESRSLAPQDEPEASSSHSQPQVHDDHGYALPASPTALKARLHEALARVESLERERKNAVAREKRAKTTVETLLGDLKEKNLINEELKERLYFYSDLQLDFMAKQGREYTKDFREFALALHLHGPKAYEYLRETRNFPLPHPHTLQRWLCSVDDEPGLNKATQDDASS